MILTQVRCICYNLCKKCHGHLLFLILSQALQEKALLEAFV